MIFLKFSSIEKRDMAMERFNDAKNSYKETRTFMNRDLAIQQRAKFSFRLNFKRLLIKWEFEKVSLDDDEGILSVAGLPVLKAAVDVFTFKVTWLDTKWAQWNELKSDPQFKELIKTAKDKLSKASKSKSKGKAARVDGDGVAWSTFHPTEPTWHITSAMAAVTLVRILIIYKGCYLECRGTYRCEAGTNMYVYGKISDRCVLYSGDKEEQVRVLLPR